MNLKGTLGLIFVALSYGHAAITPEQKTEPKEGTYTLAQTTDKDVSLYIEIRITKAANGKGFTVEGVMNRQVDAEKSYYNLSGSLTASGKLRAQYFEGTNKNDAKPLNGSWDTEFGTVLLDAIPWVTNKPIYFNEAKTLTGEFTGGDWGVVKLQTTMWGCQGSYRVSDSDRGTFSMERVAEGAGFKGRWSGQNNHRGTCETAELGSTMSVKWVCDGACNGKGGTSTWDRKSK